MKLTTGRHGGVQSKVITIQTNVAGEGASLQLVIRGEVWLPLDIKPMSVNFSRMTADAAEDPNLVQKVAIVNNMEQEAELSDLRSTNPIFLPELTVVEPGRKFELSVRFASPPKQGNTRGTIELTSNVKEMPKLTIPVNAFVAPEVEVMPATLSLPPDQSAPLTRQLHVRNNSKTPMELSDLQVSSPEIQVTLEATQPGTTFRINVVVPAGYKVSPHGDRITFKTNNPQTPEVTVPVLQMQAPSQAAKVMPQRVGQAPTVQSGDQKKEEEAKPLDKVRILDPAAEVSRTSIPARAKTDEVSSVDQKEISARPESSEQAEPPAKPAQ